MLLIINIGSTSVKTRLFDTHLTVAGQLHADYTVLTNTVIAEQFLNVDSNEQVRAFDSVEAVLRFVFAEWQNFIDTQQIKLTAIGHRIVHGGPDFHEVTVIDQDTMGDLAQLDTYAPLHNPINRLGITIAGEILSTVTQYGVFDTAFHHSMPEQASRYALPETLLPEIALRRYGFHGISCSYALHQSSSILKCQDTSLNLIVLHLGGGSSATAIGSGVSVDTSMGFSPLGGLIMGSRCGDLDPMVPMTALRSGMTLSELDQVLHKHSGLQAIAGTGDMRSILEQASAGSAQAQLAIDMYCYQIKKIIGAYYAVLGSVSALIFTGGIGENCPLIRQNIIQGLDMLGLSIDAESNQQSINIDRDIAKSHCKTRCLVIQCNEELEIAHQISAFIDPRRLSENRSRSEGKRF
ncbi:MAG: acetate/propionate family kinase [Methylococcales bacterium]